uniref:DUF1902 domain-containing protein n=1 Tax=Candidatus Kentrum sp. LPFa TaxID=2126335 RepID=A0A450WKK6_9GAMM|nr:MAG: hypothetical protein BECKLPF1236A_GA0070988_101744 [Candidatus Kentron sp. LPFa]VFK32756.1 MAG: hypothetical protein BECKLPF1236C_GA0070990_101803 [Candidatus Kentron sp. LPFa]
MSGKKKYLHCYAERKDGVWQAFCLDFLLAAQGESFEETKAKLTSMIKEYVYDAEHGENKKYAKQLLSRRAPMLWWGKYFLYMALSHLGKLHYAIRLLPNSIVPVIASEASLRTDRA